MRRLRLPDVLGNVTFLERPLHAFTIISSAQAAVRARRRQYQVRDHLIEREKAAEHQRLLINELNHRVKNSLATVQAIAYQTLRGSDVSELARRAFTERLMALARAHDILTEERWQGANVGEIIARSLEPYGGCSEGRFHLEGPPIRLAPKAALAVAMALHELATNAVNYGALSVADGHLEIVWKMVGTGGSRLLNLRWAERDGPSVVAPTSRGFGSRLIERGLAAELRGKALISYEPTGVVCTIDAPLPDAAWEEQN